MYVFHVLVNLAFLGVGVGIPPLVYYWLRLPLRGTLDRLAEMPEATEFYHRAFLITLIFAGLGAALHHVPLFPLGSTAAPPASAPGATPSPPTPASVPLTAYVASVSGGLSDIVNAVSISLLLFVGVITILAALLRRVQRPTKPS